MDKDCDLKRIYRKDKGCDVRDVQLKWKVKGDGSWTEYTPWKFDGVKMKRENTIELENVFDNEEHLPEAFEFSLVGRDDGRALQSWKVGVNNSHARGEWG